ncbi:HNH endonuclease signature motif containing protein [Phocaeicola sp.]|uniref:HNH endonuclease signature motif containing protein n=1 Tax=Phocaeicola sp. TaxID=2773926 RepID=UPI003AB59459
MSRNEDYRRLITSPAWRRLRAQKMARSPLCEDCLLEGRTRLATEVHHVTPIERGRSAEEMEKLAFDAHNLRSLCEKCHQNAHKMSKNRGKKTIKERNGREVRRFVKRWL